MSNIGCLPAKIYVSVLHIDNEKVDTDVDKKKEAESHKESSFVWSESMVDEFL